MSEKARIKEAADIMAERISIMVDALREKGFNYEQAIDLTCAMLAGPTIEVATGGIFSPPPANLH